MTIKSFTIVLIAGFTIGIGDSEAQLPAKGAALPAWQPGYLDLHHINTGRGNAAFYIFPDGTTMLFDAGEENPLEARTNSARNSIIHPNDSKKPYEWIASYIKQVAPANRKLVVDYAVLSHFHEDHMGSWYKGAPKSNKGDYLLSGITGVAELIPVNSLLDRGYPTYDMPYPMKDPAFEARLKNGPYYNYWLTMNNYFNFVKQREKEKLANGHIEAGSNTQVRMQYDGKSYPNFVVQNIKSNNRLWSGTDSSSTDLFPAFKKDDQTSFPSENALSQVLLIKYGNFRYYTGGDIPGKVDYGQADWMDVETPVSKVVGAVDVATLDHHGNRDAINENLIKAFHPRVWIEQVWSSDHPGHEVLIRLTSRFLYKGPRDLFATNMLQANKDVIGGLIDQSYKSMQGHILVRVLPGGNSYYVIILDDSVEQLKVKDVFGPYEVSAKK